MASSLFPNNPQQGSIQNPTNNSILMLSRIANMMRGKNPEQIAMNLMNMNPQFKQFMQSVQGKTPEQFSAEHGIDFTFIKNLLR